MRESVEYWEALINDAEGTLFSVEVNQLNGTYTFKTDKPGAKLLSMSPVAVPEILELAQENKDLRFKLEEYSMIISELETELEYAEAEIAQYKPDIRKSRCVL